MSIIQIQDPAKGIRALAPYILVELFLPGGTLVALLLWLSRRFRRGYTNAVASEPGPGCMATIVAQPLATPAPAADA